MATHTHTTCRCGAHLHPHNLAETLSQVYDAARQHKLPQACCVVSLLPLLLMRRVAAQCRRFKASACHTEQLAAVICEETVSDFWVVLGKPHSCGGYFTG